MKLLSPSNKPDTKVAPYTEARPNKTASVATSEYRVYWYHTLQFRIVASFLVLFLFIVLILAVVAQTLGEDLIQQQAHSKVSDAGVQVLAELERRTLMASTLVKAMANLALEAYDGRVELSAIREMLDIPSGNLIAGGGIWPEPYKLDADSERKSFFWGRDASGTLLFYNDYNLPGGPGYHNEEWYVPARYLAPGMEYWSESYIDPHTLQPMVTVSTPIIRDGELLGVATVDLRLEGLREILSAATREFGGYAFAVDRNGRFLSFPNDLLARSAEHSSSGGSLVPYMLMSELALKQAAYQDLDSLMARQTADFLHNRDNPTHASKLARQLEQESYQISRQEAELIAAAILDNNRYRSATPVVAHAVLANDYLLKDNVFVTVTTMPSTFWQIVTVMPDAAARLDAVHIINRMSMVVLLSVTLVILLASLLVWHQLTAPLRQLTTQLRCKLASDNSQTPLLKTKDRGELGALTHLFNQQTELLMQSQNQIEQLAFYDALTGLPNRRMLRDKLQEYFQSSRRDHRFGAVLFLDLDQFKHINDSLGHSVGDSVLVQISERLRRGLRGQDTIFRIGGDEFVTLILNGDKDQSVAVTHASEMAARIITLMADPILLNDNLYHISASIGVSVFSGDRYSVEDVLKQADTAMYTAKNNGRNTYRFFESSMQQAVDQRLKIEKELRIAIETNELLLYYQPQVDQYGQCHAVEALVRWQHPERGMVSPADFIPIAEESALINTMGRWVFREACRQFRSWTEQGIELDHISVNASPRQFQQGDIVAEVSAALHEFGVPANRLMVEITEGVIMDHGCNAIAKMMALKSMGVRLSVDDFGTGYSSLFYLKQLPLDQLKIDQSFVRDIATDENDLIIVETIISMAHHLRLGVIAEGVETEEQCRLLQERGCQSFQGYYFSKPMSGDELAKCLQRATEEADAKLRLVVSSGLDKLP